jgi:hypothetical protein
LIEPEKSDSYFKKRGKIYYSPNGNWFELGYNRCYADFKTFKVLSKSIAKDRNSIFYGYKIQNQVDYHTFVVDSNDVPKDKNHVYEIDYLDGLVPVEIEGIDIETFVYLGKGRLSAYGWSKDKNNYYFKNKVVNAHYETLKFITNNFFFDRDSLYVSFESWKIKTIKKIHQPPTRVNEKYIISDTTLYFVGHDTLKLKENKLESIPTHIRIVSNNVIVIDDVVVFYGHLMYRFDSKSFTLISDSEIGSFMKYYKDKYYVYLDTMIIEKAKPETFQIMKLGFSKDDKHVFYKRNILNGVDSESFTEDPKKFHEWIDKHGNRFNSKGEKIE